MSSWTQIRRVLVFLPRTPLNLALVLSLLDISPLYCPQTTISMHSSLLSKTDHKFYSLSSFPSHCFLIICYSFLSTCFSISLLWSCQWRGSVCSNAWACLLSYFTAGSASSRNIKTVSAFFCSTNSIIIQSSFCTNCDARWAACYSTCCSST